MSLINSRLVCIYLLLLSSCSLKDIGFTHVVFDFFASFEKKTKTISLRAIDGELFVLIPNGTKQKIIKQKKSNTKINLIYFYSLVNGNFLVCFNDSLNSSYERDLFFLLLYNSKNGAEKFFILTKKRILEILKTKKEYNLNDLPEYKYAFFL